MTGMHDELYRDLKACALAAIPVDPDDGTTFLQFEGRTCVWGSPDIVAAAVASAMYTVVGIRLDDARAEGVAAGRKQAAAEIRERQRQTRSGTVVDDVLDMAARIAEGGEPNAD